MKDPFEIARLGCEILKLIEDKFKMDPACNWKAYQWMNTPNPLLCGVTPSIYIDSGYGEKLLALLKESL